MSALPSGWAMVELQAVADTQLGKTLSRNAREGPHLYPYVRNRNVRWHEFDLDDLREMSFTPTETVKYDLQSGDLLVCEGGEVGRCAVWQNQRTLVFFQNAIHRVRTRDGILPSWIEFVLRLHSETGRLREHATGVTISHLTQTKLRRLRIPLAPTVEQERIVQCIKEVFVVLKFVESTLKSLSNKMAVLRSSILADAFHTERGLPLDWERTVIGEVAEVQLGRQRSPKHHTGKQMRPYLRAANVTWNGISLDDVKEMNFNDGEFERYRLKSGDLLLNEASGTPSEVGKPAIWDGQIENCCFQNTLLRLRPKELDLGYLYWYCYFSALTGRFGDAGRGVNIRHLGKRGLSRFPIPVAPHGEQSRIADDISDQFDQIRSIQDWVEDAQKQVAALRRSVLAKAFAGRLVPQDPDDEPASVLLERIAASRPTRNKRRRRARS